MKIIFSKGFRLLYAGAIFFFLFPLISCTKQESRMNQTIATEEANPLAQRFMQSQQAQKNQDTNTEPSTNGLKIPDSKYEEIIKEAEDLNVPIGEFLEDLLEREILLRKENGQKISPHFREESGMSTMKQRLTGFTGRAAGH